MEPLVSCLCLTQGRVALLQRSVACFLRQTYANRELVVIHQSDDQPTRDFLARLANPQIRTVEVPCSPRLSTGALRNISIQAAKGHYIATWDDDDWYDPARLTEQVNALVASGKSGLVLQQVILYHAPRETAFLSAIRTWENTLVVERKAVPAYPDMQRGSDTRVIDLLLHANQLATLAQPEFYVYVYHGGNLWNQAHWESNLLGQGTPLSAESSQRITQCLNQRFFDEARGVDEPL